MKRILFTLFSLVILSCSLFAQEAEKIARPAKIGISYSSFGESDVYRKAEWEGGASYHGKKFFTVTINFLKPINNWLDFETGLAYSKHTFQISTAMNPPMGVNTNTTNFQLISVPLTLRATFLKYFFVNGGLLFDIDMNADSPIDQQTGIGGIFGLAVKYDFDFGGSIFVNPYAQIHSLISNEDQQRIYESGIRIGVNYPLGGGK